MLNIDKPVLALSDRRAYADKPKQKANKIQIVENQDENEYLNDMQKEISNFADKDVMDILNKKDLSLDEKVEELAKKDVSPRLSTRASQRNNGSIGNANNTKGGGQTSHVPQEKSNFYMEQIKSFTIESKSPKNEQSTHRSKQAT